MEDQKASRDHALTTTGVDNLRMWAAFAGRNAKAERVGVPKATWTVMERQLRACADQLDHARAVECEGCGGSGVEMYVGWGNSVNERRCDACDGTGRAPYPPVIRDAVPGRNPSKQRKPDNERSTQEAGGVGRRP